MARVLGLVLLAALQALAYAHAQEAYALGRPAGRLLVEAKTPPKDAKKQAQPKAHHKKAHAKKKAQGPKKPEPIKVRWSCQRNPIFNTKPPLMMYNCQMFSLYDHPVCVRLNCTGLKVGACPISGTGQGTNDITPAPCSWNLIQPQGANACVPNSPVYPKSNAAFGFTVDTTQPLIMKTMGVYASSDGASCTVYSPDDPNDDDN